MDTREKRAAAFKVMEDLMTKMDNGKSPTDAERLAFDKAEAEMRMCDLALKGGYETRGVYGSDPVETRTASQHPGVGTSGTYRWSPAAEVRGEPNEAIGPGQTMAQWVERAAENGVHYSRSENKGPERIANHDNGFLNEYWAQRLGFRPQGAEIRALSEDTSGSGLAVTPQAWTAQVIDYLYANSVMGRLGMSRMAMPTEIYNMPQFTAPVQPAWLAENATIGLDANPAFSSLALNAKGGFKDITTYSLELAQDAYVSGGLPSFLAQSAARNYALAVDNAAIFGVSGNAGNPGLLNESGVVNRGYTGTSGTTGVAPADTLEFSKVAEMIRNVNAEPSGGILTNPSVYGTVSRLNASTYAKFWELPADVNLPFVYSTIMPKVETVASGAPALETGGALSSFVMGPFERVVMGVHLEMTNRPLVERYADSGAVGLFSMMRFSIRTSHPETFVRTGGVVTT